MAKARKKTHAKRKPHATKRKKKAKGFWARLTGF